MTGLGIAFFASFSTIELSNMILGGVVDISTCIESPDVLQLILTYFITANSCFKNIFNFQNIQKFSGNAQLFVDFPLFDYFRLLYPLN